MTIALSLLEALGGVNNLVSIEPCSMRIRVEVVHQRLVNEDKLRMPGILAVVRSGDIVQIIAGLQSDDIAEAMSKELTRSDENPVGEATEQ